jgi:16S rRNA (guanine1207-N2)-methyltransferase
VDGAHGGQYFEPQPAVTSAPRRLRLDLPDLSLQLTADRGVFSAEAVDDGTRLLLGQGPALPAAATTVVDLGCGYGPIAVTLARRLPSATVWAVDVNERAVELTRTNAEANHAPNVRALVVPEDPTAGVPGLDPDLAIDVLWSNPPIRIGKARLHALLEVWLARLAPAGEACLVVHKHLGSDSLARWLVDHGWPTTRLLSQGGYRLLRITRTADPTEPEPG